MAETLFGLFPSSSYVQAVRVKGEEDDIEAFYRYWKDRAAALGAAEAASRIIIQKYDHFAGALEKLQASDLSPVIRRPCWHLYRDMAIFIDGRVPLCREDLKALKGEGDLPLMGNAFSEDLRVIWERGNSSCLEQARREYRGICQDCDEHYTYNF